MNLEYKNLLPDNFPPKSRVWVYQSNRLFSLSEALEIEKSLEGFCGEWHTHGTPVKAYANLFFGQFVVLMADESAAYVGGCSTDSSVNFVKSLGAKYGVDFFDRASLAFVIKDKVQLLPLNQLSYAVENGFINGETLYFNNLVLNKEQLEQDWIIPVKDSWLAKKLKLQQA